MTEKHTGVAYRKKHGTYQAYIEDNGEQTTIGTFQDEDSAAIARDKYILENELPHRLSKLFPGWIIELEKKHAGALQYIEGQKVDIEGLKARIKELESDGGAAAWVLEWMVAEKYRKPDVPALVEKARKNYRQTLAQITELEAELKQCKK